MLSWRHQLHAFPEVSGQEVQTATRIAQCLRECAADAVIENLGGTGVLGVFESHQPGPCTLLRAELDALPIPETNVFAHRSSIPDAAHLCGHDGHMSILLGLAATLQQHPPRRGKVLLLFQPAEETGQGAQQVLADTRWQTIQPDWVFALHNLPGYPVGQVVWREGPFNAAVKSLVLRWQGKTAHAAEPEKGKNPVRAMAELVLQLPAMEVSNAVEPDFCLITPVHQLVGSPAYGTAAGYGELHLTLRTWSEATMESVAHKLLKTAATLAKRDGLALDYSWTEAFTASYNDPAAVELLKEAMNQGAIPNRNSPEPMRWGEDFGAFTQSYPGAMVGLGAGKDHPALHRPDYDFPDELSVMGLHLWLQVLTQTGNWQPTRD